MSRGLCQLHWRRVRDGRPLLGPPQLPEVGQVYECVVCGAQWCRLPGNRSDRTTCSEACWAQVVGAPRGRNLERDEEILQLARDGVPYREIAERFGVTEGRVGQITVAAGIRRRRPNGASRRARAAKRRGSATSGR